MTMKKLLESLDRIAEASFDPNDSSTWDSDPGDESESMSHPGRDREMMMIEEQLDELESHLIAAIDAANQLHTLGRTVSGPFSGQIRSYLIPHLEAWIDDRNQPGSLATLRRMLGQ